MSGSPAGRTRLRIRFAKLGKVRWTSHRDVARMWERAFRRVGLPLAYSEGFSPRPRVSFGLALPTGHESVAEYLDVELASMDGITLDGLPELLSDALPEGVDATAVALLEPGSPSLQEDVEACTWRWRLWPAEGEAAEEPAALIERVVTAGELPVRRTRKGREVIEDIRPAIERLSLDGDWFEADLATRPVSVRPSDVTAAFGGGLAERDVRRTHQWISRQGARSEPLVAAGPVPAQHALERAS